ncbi:MAG TPA: capsule assembly Wzi family protein, partial [Gammaproteobacteria bacterium]|nr:capsule assembly Wzi family protein [Gammaproteobacteria bacterium]
MPEIKRISLTAIAAVLALAAAPVVADPWLKPGDLALRHDIQLLADAGVLRSPVTTWPIPWATIAADLGDGGGLEALDPAVLAARVRVLQRFNRVRGLGGFQPNAKLGVRSDDFWLRNFEDTPREQGEARAGVSWMGERFAARAQLSFASDPRPGDREWRGDGSYLAAVIGNHIVHAGALDRWWGPSHDDTLILSSNARPVPGFGIERSAALPFR